MELQIISDLHLEFFHPTKGLKSAIFNTRLKSKNIALLGDIGYPSTKLYKGYIKYLSDNCDNVFIIAGNHEYYNNSTDISETESQLENISKEYLNVHYLQNNFIELGDYIIAGTTLWINYGELDHKTVIEELNDFDCIFKNGGHKLCPLDIVDLHNNAINFLEKLVKSHKNKKIIILTHHAPTLQDSSVPELLDDPLKLAYATNLEYLMTDNVVLWGYGHTHHKSDIIINKTRVYSNPRGYIDEKTGYKYGETLIIN